MNIIKYVIKIRADISKIEQTTIELSMKSKVGSLKVLTKLTNLQLNY